MMTPSGLPRKSSEIFSNLGNFSENVRERSYDLPKSFGEFRKSCVSSPKSWENHQKRRHQYVYIIKEHYRLARSYECYVLVARRISHFTAVGRALASWLMRRVRSERSGFEP